MENISTTWQIPFKGKVISAHSDEKIQILVDFGLTMVDYLKIRIPTRKRLYFSLPYKAQRKIRFWLTEKFKFKVKWPRYFRTSKTHQEYWKNRKVDWEKDYLSTWNHPHRQVLRKFLEQMQWFSLMEIGCGGGANLVQIVKNLKGRQFQLGGTDINAEAIALARKTFMGAHFFVCPNDDVMMSDKATDIILSDMSLIYVGKDKIDKTLEEFKRVSRNWLILCEFDDVRWWRRLWIKMVSGYNVYDYKKMLVDKGFYDVVKYKLRNEDWPGSQGTYQEGLRYIIIAKVPTHI